MKRSNGKMTVSSIFAVLILAYIGFVGFKLIMSGVNKKEMNSVFTSTLAAMRSEYTEALAHEAITRELINHKIGIENSFIQVKKDQGQISYHVEYDEILDLILFKKKGRIVIIDSLDAAGI